MNKEDIDEYFNICIKEKLNSAEQIALLKKYVGDENLQDNGTISSIIYSRLEGAALDYFEERLIAHGANALISYEREKNARERFENNIKNLINGKSNHEIMDLFQESLTDAEKLEILGILPKSFPFSDEFILEELNKTTRVVIKLNLILRIKDSNLRLKIIQEQFDSYSSIVKSEIDNLTDELKMQALASLETDLDKVVVIIYLQTELKIKALALLEDDYYKNVVIETLPDELKIKALDSLEHDEMKVEVIKNLPDELKIKALDSLEHDEEKAKVIENLPQKFRNKLKYESLKAEAIKILPDKLKIKALASLENEGNKAKVIKTLPTELKLQVLDTLEYDTSKVSVIKTLPTELKLQVLDTLEYDTSKVSVINTLPDNLRKSGISKLNIEGYKANVISSIQNDLNFKIEQLINLKENQSINKVLKSILATPNLDCELIMKTLNAIQSDECRLIFIMRLGDETKIKLINEPKQFISPELCNVIRRNISNTELILKNLKTFVQKEGAEIEDLDEAKHILSRMNMKNAEVIKNIDFRMLDKKYINTLGEDRINLISCYPDIQEKILGLNEKQLYLLDRCLDLKEKQGVEEWTVLANEILKYIGEYDVLLENLGDTEKLQNLSEQDILDLIPILQTKNWCEIKDMSDVKDFKKILEKKTREIIYSDTTTLIEKKEAILFKIFGHDKKYADEIIQKFGENNEDLEQNEFTFYVRALKELEKIQNETTLREIYENCDFVQIDKVLFERGLKGEYGKKINEGLFKPAQNNEEIVFLPTSSLEEKIGIVNLENNKPIEEHILSKTKVYKDIGMQISLDDIIESAKDIEPLFDKVEEVQSQNHSTSNVHGIQHVKNVLLLSNYIGLKNGISPQDLEILREAAIYHDISHTRAGDPRHAKLGADWYLQNVNSNLNKEEVAYLIESHELKSKEQMVDLALHIFPNITEERKEQLVKCAEILQDADRLDILRYDIENPKSQRFDAERLNDSKNKELISAVINLNTRQGLNNNYLRIKNDSICLGSNIIEAGTDFKIIMTSVGAFWRESIPKDYKADWNRPAIGTQHFCTSYIRNDMIGTAPIRSICYGFASMREDALMLSGPNDLNSSYGGFVSEAFCKEKYLSPEKLINHTNRYNELCYRRIQGGEKKQPDYILVFRKDGVIENMREAQRASKQWGNMPIVIVDIDACLKSEKAKVKEMLSDYSQNPSLELAKEIAQKVRNNRVTDTSFCRDFEAQLVNIRKYLKSAQRYKMQKNTIGIDELEEISESVSAGKRKQVSREIKQIYQKILEIGKGEQSSER